MKSPNELLSMVLANTTDDLFVLNPCEVINVNGNYVDVKIYINDEYPNMILYNVPIQRQETQRAYIFLGIKEGDRGTLKFFDRSTEGYLQSDFDYNSDDRQHDINDRCFELGFIPDKEAYVYRDKVDGEDIEIAIGIKEKKIDIVLTDNGIKIRGDVAIDGDLTVSGTVKGKINATNGLKSGTNLDLVNVSNGIVTGKGSSDE